MRPTTSPVTSAPATEPSPEDDLITLDELCEMGRMGRDAYRNLRRQGRTPTAYKMGRRLYFRRSDAEQWLVNDRMIRLDPPRPMP